MNFLLNFGYFLGAIAFLILIHEIGHFLAARLFKIDVEEFGIGFPPRMLTLFKKKETDYTLNWLPLGGFVRLKAMDDPDEPNGFAAASPWARIAVLLAGPLFNVISAILLFSVIFYRIGEPITDQVLVLLVAEDSPAAIAGLQPDDLILKVADEEINSTGELKAQVDAHLGEEIQFVYQRDDQVLTTSLTPRINPPENQGAIGIIMSNPTRPIPYSSALVVGVQAIGEHTRLLVTLPGRLISGELDPSQGRLLGYKGMYDVFTNQRERDANLPVASPEGIYTLNFVASISVSLALLNLFPIPALDGGRILFILPEIVLRKRVPPALENVVNLIGFSLMILLLIYINIQDFVNPINLP
ncbi:RIP metalloprotease [Chloroflexota bacterium]